MPEPVRIMPPLSVMDQTKPWSDDKLGRGKFAAILTRVVQDEIEPFVVAVNGKWGSGKTFFLERWRQELENTGLTALYFNAWRDDFVEDPLVALIGQLYIHLQNRPQCQKKLDALVGVCQKSIELGAYSLMDVAQDLTGVDIKDKLKRTCYAFNFTVEQYRDLQTNRKQLIDRLWELVNCVYDNNTDAIHRPIVFIIDELDRCRPDYAIKILERVKHLMCVSGIAFVFGIDRDELSKTIHAVYGEINSDNYLRRFFDLEFQLPEASIDEFIDFKREQYGLSNAFKGHGNEQECIRYVAEFNQIFKVLAKSHALTLREIEFAYKMFMVSIRGLFDNYYVLPSVLALMIFLKIANKALYTQLKERIAKPKDIIDFIFDGLTVLDDIWARNRIIFAVYFSLGKMLDSNSSWQQLMNYTSAKTTYFGAENIFPKILLGMSDRSRKAVYDSLCEFVNTSFAGHWNGHKAVEQVAMLLDSCAYT